MCAPRPASSKPPPLPASLRLLHLHTRSVASTRSQLDSDIRRLRLRAVAETYGGRLLRAHVPHVRVGQVRPDVDHKARPFIGTPMPRMPPQRRVRPLPHPTPPTPLADPATSLSRSDGGLTGVTIDPKLFRVYTSFQAVPGGRLDSITGVLDWQQSAVTNGWPLGWWTLIPRSEADIVGGQPISNASGVIRVNSIPELYQQQLKYASPSPSVGGALHTSIAVPNNPQRAVCTTCTLPRAS